MAPVRETHILPLTGGGFNAEGSPLEPALRRRYRMSIQTGGVMTDNKYFLIGVLIAAFLFVVSYFYFLFDAISSPT